MANCDTYFLTKSKGSRKSLGYYIMLGKVTKVDEYIHWVDFVQLMLMVFDAQDLPSVFLGTMNFSKNASGVIHQTRPSKKWHFGPSPHLSNIVQLEETPSSPFTDVRIVSWTYETRKKLRSARPWTGGRGVCRTLRNSETLRLWTSGLWPTSVVVHVCSHTPPPFDRTSLMDGPFCVLILYVFG